MVNRSSRSPSPSITSPDPPTSAVPRWIWLLLILLGACIIGVTAGLLSYAAGNNIPEAILTGGGAFAGAVGLLLAMAHYAAT